MNSIYVVGGMTCDHCANAVSDEIGELDGVEEVSVDLATGRVTVTVVWPLSDDDVRAAVEEAGYTLVNPA